MSLLRRRHGPGASALANAPLPLTAMLDIALTITVLLIAVMGTSGKPERAVPVSLPKAGAAGQPAPGLSVTIERSGAVRLDGRDATPADLRAAAQGMATATIRADGAVAHRVVVGVVDVLRQAGVGKVYYAAEEGVVEW